MTKEPIQNVFLLSGGRTSALMLRLMLDKLPDFREQFIICFCNTGKERPQTLDFVHEMETRWDIPVKWIEYRRVPAIDIPPMVFPTKRRNLNLMNAAEKKQSVHWFKLVDYQTASRNGEPFDELLNWMTVLPNVVSRGCSMQLKIRTAMRYLFSLGVKQYSPHIGIRKDESHRSVEILANCDSFEHPKFPLIEMGVSEVDVTKFWNTNDFDLQLEQHEGNCDLCFLKAKWKRIMLIQKNPGMVDWWKNWESKKSSSTTGNGTIFRMGEAYADIEHLALQDNRQDQFCFTPEKDIPCSCAERGFNSSDEI